MKTTFHTALVLTLLAASAAAQAGEIKGPPPTTNDPAPGTSISNGNSLCSFSGLNDTPDGFPPAGDPGGIAQSYGYFMGQFDLYNPSNPDERDDFLFPGVGCNPQRSFGTH